MKIFQQENLKNKMSWLTNNEIPFQENIFYKYYHQIYYSIEQKEIIKKFLTRFSNNKYASSVDVAQDVRQFSDHSGYNFKKHGKKEHTSVLTWVCSCVSKKPSSRGKLNQFKRRYDSSKSLDYTSAFDDETENLISSKRRKIKRTNDQSCCFRIKFHLCKKEKVYVLKKDSNLSHNHSPSSSCSNFSHKAHTSKSRNIKFTPENIRYIVQTLYREIWEFKITSDETIIKIREHVFYTTSNQYKNDQIFQKNFKKKLNYFIKSIINQLFDLVKQNVSKELVFYEIYKCFLKKGANYLNHESLEFLKCA